MSVEVRQFNCPQCGAPLDIKNLGRSKSLVCPNCGSQIDLTRPPYQVIGNVGQRPVPIGVPFQLGMQGAIGPDTFAIIGRMRYRDQDDEWDEWLMLSAGGAYRWLSDSADVGMVFWKPFTPPAPIDPSIIERGGVFNLGYGPAQVRSRGSAVIAYLEGELTWRGRLGDRMDYAEALAGNTLYSIEWTPTEVEFFQGQSLDRGAIEAAFGLARSAGVPQGAGGVPGGPPVGARSRGGCAGVPIAAVIFIVVVVLLCIVFSSFGGGGGYSTGFSGGSYPSTSGGSIRSGGSGSRSTGGGSSGGGGK